MSRLILASASPRRKELMSLAGLDFEVITSNVEEIIPQNCAPCEVAKSLAEQKARAVADLNPGRTVIGADTIVVADSVILGKPVDRNDAVRMLKLLSGRAHEVYTGVAVLGAGAEKIFCEKTDVFFNSLTDSEIESYVNTGDPMDKAGAYGIQGVGCTLVKGINGDFYNVMGLPISRLYRELRDINV